MATESLTYAQIAERLSINTEAARSLVRRHRLPRHTANDGKVVILVDLAELPHKKLSRPPPVDQPETGRLRLEELWARIAVLEADLRLANERAAGLRSDYERERDRGDRLMAMHEAELSAMRKALQDRMETDRSSGVELARRMQTVEPDPPQRSRVGRAWRWFLKN